MAEAPRDDNSIPTLLAVSNADGVTPVVLWADPTTHRLLVDLPTAAGDVSGPSSSTDLAVAVFDGTGGKTIKQTSSVPVLITSIGDIHTLNNVYLMALKSIAGGAGTLAYQSTASNTTITLPNNGGSAYNVVGDSVTQTLTNKTLTSPTINTPALSADSVDAITEIAAALKSGADGTLITGTAGTSGDLSQWNGDGDLVDGPTPPSGTIVGTTDTQTLSAKTLVDPIIDAVTGVQMSAASGVLTISGIGNTNNESLLIDLEQADDIFLGPTATGVDLTLRAGTSGAVYFNTGGSDRFLINGNQFRGSTTNGPDVRNETTSSTNPIYTRRNNNEAGMGWNADNELSFITSSTERLRITTTLDPKVAIDMTSSSLTNYDASLTASGIVELATVAETNTGTDATRAVTPDGLDGWTGSAQVVTVGTVTSGNVDAVVSAADLTTAGKVELATIAETDTGTDATRAVTPDGLQGSKRNIRYMVFVLIGDATDVAADTSIGGDWTVPFSGTILQDDTLHDQLAATTDTAGTTGTMVVDIHLNGTTIMTTNKLDIESTEKGTQTATTQPDLTTTAISAGDILTFDIDAVHTTAAKGLKVFMAIRED